MDPDETVLSRYWTALGQADGPTMAGCYADDARFQDAVFRLQGAQIGTMWRGLMPEGNAVRIETSALSVVDGTGTGTWDATYTFPATGRAVHNHIRSTIRAHDGRIIEHRDRFGFWKWSRQAFGPVGWLLGWTPLLRNAVRRKAMARFERR